MDSVDAIQKQLRAAAGPEKAASLPRFFKAGPGQYAASDRFLGITVPNIRLVATRFPDLPLSAVETLLKSEWHEERACALYILVAQFAAGDSAARTAIYSFYLRHTARINNWDLVDASSEFIVGPYLENRPEKMAVLTRLAASESLWERRIAILATFDYIKKGRADEALAVINQLLHDKHDLIQKAVGWMLREIGKRVDRATLVSFLDEHAHDMPRTTLRYAIEHLPPEQRAYYLTLKSVN